MFEINLPKSFKIICPAFTNNLAKLVVKKCYKSSLFKHLGKTLIEYWINFCKCSTGTSITVVIRVLSAVKTQVIALKREDGLKDY
jgi:hypothetical protein